MLTLNALIKVLSEKGIVGKEEILQKVRQLEKQAEARKWSRSGS